MVARAPCAQPRATTRRYSLSLEGFLHTHTHTHTHRYSLSLEGFLSDCMEGLFHILTLAYLCIPLLAVFAKMVRMVVHSMAPSYNTLPQQCGGASEKRVVMDEESMSTAIQAVCPFQSVSPHKFGLLVFWYSLHYVCVCVGVCVWLCVCCVCLCVCARACGWMGE